MGQQIDRSEFTDEDFRIFGARLAEETERIERWFRDGRLSEAAPVAGFELEAWLTDEHYDPAPRSDTLLEYLDDPLLTTELARFNLELNTPPRALRADVLRQMERDLDATWQRCRDGAAALGMRLVIIGILPTVRQQQLGRAAMTPQPRFVALNEQVLRQRGGRPLRIDIRGRERLRTSHPDVMLESAATSFQIHMQVPASRAADYYNAAILGSGPLLAAVANAPYLFGRDLWAETRIPLFEQAVESGGIGGAAGGPPRRCGFGTGYVRRSLIDVFRENLEHFPVLLPMHVDEPESPLLHLQLQNGTIWRWNRPLVGTGDGGEPHLRLEHRSVPGGPTAVDAIANAALFYGMAQFHARLEGRPPSEQLAFTTARDNFYACARQGLDARVRWSDETVHRPVARLLLDELLPRADAGLSDLGLVRADIDRYLGIIGDRVKTGRTGAGWQRAWVEHHGRDMAALTAAYAGRQAEGLPVHEWPL